MVCTDKGLGALGVQAGRMIAAGGNPASAAVNMAMPMPKAVTPSNLTQAQASVATQIVVPAAAGVVAGPAIGALEGTSMATGALDAAIASRIGKPGAMIGAYDSTTGATAVGVSGDISRLGTINPQISAAADQVGGMGAVNPGASAPVGCCAEVDAANQLTNAGSDLSNVRFTDAVRPRTGEVVPKCDNCEKMFPKD